MGCGRETLVAGKVRGNDIQYRGREERKRQVRERERKERGIQGRRTQRQERDTNMREVEGENERDMLTMKQYIHKKIPEHRKCYLQTLVTLPHPH